MDEGQSTGKYAVLRMVGNSMKAVPTAKICAEVLYYTEEVKAICMGDIVWGPIIGSTDGA